MASRGIIARKTGEHSFVARYHHSDSYPGALGASLYRLYRHFNKDAATMMHYLIEGHPAGWSTIVNRDFTLSPMFVDGPDRAMDRHPQCYCHGDRNDGTLTITSLQEAIQWYAAYAYIIDEATAHMTILRRLGTSKEWSALANVDLNGPEPEWSLS